MGSFNPLRENRPVELEIAGDENNRYRSRVEAVLDHELHVAAPIKGGALVPVQLGTVIKITYVDTVAIYTYLCEVIARNGDVPPTLTLGKPFDFKKIQRRNFIRMWVNVPVNLHKLNQDYTSTGELFTSSTVDLSGGGMLFTTNYDLKSEDLLEGTIKLTVKDNIKVTGRVVRIIENPPKSEDRLSAGFEFISIDETDRDKIMKYIFNQQRELRKKGLL